MAPMILRPLKIAPFQDPQELFTFVLRKVSEVGPKDVIHSLTRETITLLLSSLNLRLRTRLMAKFMPILNTKVDLPPEKKDYKREEILMILSKVPGSSPHLADDVYGATLEGIWYLLPEEELEDLILSLPVEVALDLRAARPGDKRGSF